MPRTVLPALALTLALAVSAAAQESAPPATPSTPTPAAAAPDSAPGPAAAQVERLARGVHVVRIGEAGNVLVVEGRDGLLLVDSQDSTHAATLDAAIARLSRRAPRIVVNTHYHDDHRYGNPRWAARGAALWAHERMAAQAAKDTVIPEMGDWHRRAAPPEALPRNTVRDSLRLPFEGREVRAYHLPAAHTDGDLMVWLPREDLVHVGDVVEVGAPPFIDWWAGGTLDGTIAACDRILARAGPRTRIVPGHGAVVDRAWVAEYRRMLATVGERAREAIGAGRSRAEFADSNPCAEWVERLGGPRRARRLAVQVYFGLSGMKP